MRTLSTCTFLPLSHTQAIPPYVFSSLSKATRNMFSYLLLSKNAIQLKGILYGRFPPALSILYLKTTIFLKGFSLALVKLYF